jgi:hypothetical protein
MDSPTNRSLHLVSPLKAQTGIIAMTCIGAAFVGALVTVLFAKGQEALLIVLIAAALVISLGAVALFAWIPELCADLSGLRCRTGFRWRSIEWNEIAVIRTGQRLEVARTVPSDHFEVTVGRMKTIGGVSVDSNSVAADLRALCGEGPSTACPEVDAEAASRAFGSSRVTTIVVAALVICGVVALMVSLR